jgi:hypothetical protein
VQHAFQEPNPTLVSDENKWLTSSAKERLRLILLAHRSTAHEAQQEARALLRDYLKQHGYQASSAAFVDMGWTGSVPRNLCRALNDEPVSGSDHHLQMLFFGSYLSPTQARSEGVSLNSWYFSETGIPVTTGDETVPTRAQLLYSVRHFVELFVSGAEGKYAGFKRQPDGNVSATQDPAHNPKQIANFLSPLHEQALTFCRDLLPHLQQETWAEGARLEWYLDSVLYRLFWIPRAHEVKILGNLPIQGSAFSSLPHFASLVFPDRDSGPRSASMLAESCQRSIWKRGWLTQLSEIEICLVPSLATLCGHPNFNSNLTPRTDLWSSESADHEEQKPSLPIV